MFYFLISLASFICFYMYQLFVNYSLFLFWYQTFLLRVCLFFLKLIYRSSSRAGLLIAQVFIPKNVFISPSFLKDCLAKNRNINGKLFSYIFHCLLLFLFAVKKFCQSYFPFFGVMCLISLCLFFRFSLFLW